MDPVALVMLSLLAAGTLVGIVAIAGHFSSVRRDRMLTHEERMKALELGRDIGPALGSAALVKSASGDQNDGGDTVGLGSSDALARKCFSTAVWVAFWGFVAASQSHMVGPPGQYKWAVSIAIAAAVGSIGVTAMICGAVIASRSSPAPSTRGLATDKPVVDRDAFETVR